MFKNPLFWAIAIPTAILFCIAFYYSVKKTKTQKQKSQEVAPTKKEAIPFESLNHWPD